MYLDRNMIIFEIDGLFTIKWQLYHKDDDAKKKEEEMFFFQYFFPLYDNL